jgi:class 3 adenylate cyclase
LLRTPDGGEHRVAPGDVVGRDMEGGIFADVETISRRHAEFLFKGGAWFLQDLGSANGTYLEGVKLPPRTPVPLRAGQTIHLSPGFEAAVEAVPSPPETPPCAADDDGREQAFVMFVDLKGSTEYFQDMGTIVASKWILNFYNMLSAIVAKHEGRHIKNIGDAILAVFKDPVKSVRAALAMQRTIANHNATTDAANHYCLRIAINGGKVLFENNDVFGNAVNIASRLQNATPSGSIYMTDSLRAVIGEAVESGALPVEVLHVRDERFRGVRGETGVYEIVPRP